MLSLFAGRLIQLQGMESGNYRKLASQERDKTIPLPALRGSITGANGQVLAMTVATYMVGVDPTQIPAAKLQHVAGSLAGPLGMTPDAVLSLLQHPTSPQYVVLAKGVPAQASSQITALGLPGIHQIASYARSYPQGSVAANIIGFTGTRKGVLTGGAGLELQHNALLAGRSGSEQVQIGTDGQPIPLAGGRTTPVVNGSSLRLTIVPALQYAAEQACAAQVKKTKADNCTVVIIQPKTGAVLAMAQYPTYNPSDVTNVDQTTNLAVQAQFQPGSTAKVITASAALEHGGQTPMSAYKIPYQIREGGQFIHDAEWAPGEHYTIAGIIAHSSNIGMSQVAKHISEQTQYDYLRAFGLGQPTGVGLPNESDGDLPPVSQWYGDTRFTLSFGQGVAATAMQMAEVYATIANGGVRVQPTLIEGTTDSAGKYTEAAPSPSHRVIQAKTARELLQIMQQVPGIDAEGGPAVGGHPRLRDRRQDRNLAGVQRAMRPVRLRIELDRRGPGRQAAARRLGERAEPAQGRPFRRHRRRPGLLPGHEGRARHAANPAGRGQTCEGTPERPVMEVPSARGDPSRVPAAAAAVGAQHAARRPAGRRGQSHVAERAGFPVRAYPRLPVGETR